MSNKSPAPTLLPILRSAQQGRILAAVLDDPTREATASELARQLGVPQPSVARELKRAQSAGILKSRTIGRNVLVSADETSIYFPALRELMVRAFGPPSRLADALRGLAGVDAVYIFGSWAARFLGAPGARPRDLDVLVLGAPDETAVFRAVEKVRQDLGYEIQVTIRAANWVASGRGSFHDTVLSRPMVQVLPARQPT